MYFQSVVCILPLLVFPSGLGNLLSDLVNVSREFLGFPSDLIEDTWKFDDSYDFVVVGAGSAGCALAHRLAQVDKWRILLLEAGKDEILMTDVPLASTYWSLTDYSWGYKTVPQKDSCLAMEGRRCVWPKGKSVGGSSTINFLVYTRGHPKDYDEWEKMGNPGWGWRNVLPYFKRLERVEIPELRKSALRGRNGPLNINRVPWRTPLLDSFLEAGRELGYDVGNDQNGEKQIGFSYVQATMKKGKRVSSSKAYIRSVRGKKNLRVAKEARVTKIMLDPPPTKKTAIGVEFVKNGRFYRVRAKKEVLLSAGSINSPQLLMLSGIGPKDHLSEMLIPVAEDLPVGENLQDHVSHVSLVFLVNETVSLVDRRIATDPRVAFDYARRNTGPLTSPSGVEGIAFVNTVLPEGIPRRGRREDVADVEIVMSAGSLAGDTAGGLRRSLGLRDDIFFSMYGKVMGRDSFTLVPVLLKPRSRGRIRLKSKNPFHGPLLYPNYYREKEDVSTMIRGIKMAIEIAEARSFRKFNATLYPAKFPACSHLEFGRDDYWECAIRQSTNNLHHQVGTCKMGPQNDPTSVVGPDLRVHGIRNLRVVDCSVMPVIPSGHTNSMAIMIAEKAADMIKRTWLK